MRVTIYQRLSKKRRDCPSFLKLLRKWQFLQSVRFELKFSVFGRGLFFFYEMLFLLAKWVSWISSPRKIAVNWIFLYVSLFISCNLSNRLSVIEGTRTQSQES